MEKFVEFEIHDYMDMYPQKQITTIKGETLEEISQNSREWARQMNSIYSGGTTTFVKVMTAKEAREYLDTEIAKITDPDASDELWIEQGNELYRKCYEE